MRYYVWFSQIRSQIIAKDRNTLMLRYVIVVDKQITEGIIVATNWQHVFSGQCYWYGEAPYYQEDFFAITGKRIKIQ